MSPELAQWLPYILIGLVVLLLVVWLVMRANRKTTVLGDETSGKDVLDEGAAPAARNQALIDSPTSVEQTLGQTSANANSDQIAAAGATADAEAGASVAPSVVNAPPPPEDASKGDDLKRIKGVGPKLVTILHNEGVTTFGQIAAWSESDIDRIDEKLGKFAGRIRRDRWVEQAKLLESGDESGFAASFGQNR